MMLRVLFIAIVTLLSQARAVLALTPDELLLVANKNVPASVELAKYYATARHVAESRILRLDLPTTEAILPGNYEPRLAAPVREFLASPGGQGVKCVVLFQGVPLVLRATESTDAERAEAKRLRQITDALAAPGVALADAMEQALRDAGVDLPKTALPNATLGQAQQRIGKAEQAVHIWAGAGRSQTQLQSVQTALQAVKRQSLERAVKTLDAIEPGAASQPADPTAVRPLASQPRDAAARLTLRREIASLGGIFPLAQMIDTQYTWITSEETDAAVDSELALVRTPDFPRYRWQNNPLNFRAPPGGGTAAVMVARIDGPTPEIARRLIDDAIAVEKTGLDGVAVFDSRGIAAPPNTPIGSYAWYDQAVRDAAALVKAKSTLKVVTDDREQVLLPKTVDNVAVYCGWYSLQNYIPGCTYVRGAVGFHVASLEMTSLRAPLSKEWVPNLLKAGIDGTLGAVNEPYLHAFPRPEEFFPLLLSGKFTLAEVYWKTIPMTSWKIALIGDPLYNPFAAKPAIKLDDTPLTGVR